MITIRINPEIELICNLVENYYNQYSNIQSLNIGSYQLYNKQLELTFYKHQNYISNKNFKFKSSVYLDFKDKEDFQIRSTLNQEYLIYLSKVYNKITFEQYCLNSLNLIVYTSNDTVFSVCNFVLGVYFNKQREAILYIPQLYIDVLYIQTTFKPLSKLKLKRLDY